MDDLQITARVIEVPNPKNADEKVGGYAILVDGKKMAQVAFVRRFGANTYTTFENQVDMEVRKARKAVDSIKELFATAEVLQ